MSCVEELGTTQRILDGGLAYTLERSGLVKIDVRATKAPRKEQHVMQFGGQAKRPLLYKVYLRLKTGGSIEASVAQLVRAPV